MERILKLVSREETNPFADPSRANNGGGYSHPLLNYKGVINGESIDVSIHDTSCGEFGYRYSVDVSTPLGDYSYYYNSMDNRWGGKRMEISPSISPILSHVTRDITARKLSRNKYTLD